MFLRRISRKRDSEMTHQLYETATKSGGPQVFVSLVIRYYCGLKVARNGLLPFRYQYSVLIQILTVR